MKDGPDRVIGIGLDRIHHVYRRRPVLHEGRTDAAIVFAQGLFGHDIQRAAKVAHQISRRHAVNHQGAARRHIQMILRRQPFLQKIGCGPSHVQSSREPSATCLVGTGRSWLTIDEVPMAGPIHRFKRTYSIRQWPGPERVAPRHFPGMRSAVCRTSSSFSAPPEASSMRQNNPYSTGFSGGSRSLASRTRSDGRRHSAII